MTNADDLLAALVAGIGDNGRVRHVEVIPERPGTHADWPIWADDGVVGAYRRLDIELPWRHQVEGAEAIARGLTTALATSTGSGKSLSYWLPILSEVRRAKVALVPGRIGGDQRVGALYLSPTKALAADQASSLRQLLAAGGLRDVVADTCDGDTAREARDWIRAHSDIVLTNPDFLHFSLLANHQRWSRLLRSLRFVVIDEAHAYRGLFGAHLALVLRRLARLRAHYAAPGAPPLTFVVASATAADPAATASVLTGTPHDEVAVVSADSAPHGPRVFALWQPGQIVDSSQIADGRVLSVVGDLLDSEDAVVDALTDVGDAPRRSAISEAGLISGELVRLGARLLTFTRSRRGAETVATIANEYVVSREGWERVGAGRSDGNARTFGHLDAANTADAATATTANAADTVVAYPIAAYRGGYLPEERRALESAIATGALRALATTNALELGIDISGLDAVVIAGWPGSRASIWQQAGRAGRAGRAGLVILVARQDPLDTYLLDNPESLFDAPVEMTVMDPSNRYVLAPHLCAAAAELPLTASELGASADTDADNSASPSKTSTAANTRNVDESSDDRGETISTGQTTSVDETIDADRTSIFGPTAAAVADELAGAGFLKRRGDRWFWTRPEPATALTDLRGAGEGSVTIVEADSGRVIGTIDAAGADATVHDHAVYVHQGESFQVTAYDPAERIAAVRRASVDFHTWARSVTNMEIVETRLQHPGRVEGVVWSFGDVTVRSQVVEFERKRNTDNQSLGRFPLELPERAHETAAVWWTMSPAVLERSRLARGDIPGALHAAEHAAIGVLPLLATCDRSDIGGLSTAWHDQTGEATIFVHDGAPGGAGFSERAFHLAHPWLEATADVIERCRCAHGCPACVQSPKCGNGNNPLDKPGALRLLRAVLDSRPAATNADARVPGLAT